MTCGTPTRRYWRLMRRVAMCTSLLTAAILALGATIAGASTFVGRCQFSGAFSYAHPVGFAPTAVHWSDRGSGTCTGRVDGRSVTVPATVEESLQDDIGGCGPLSDARGNGLIGLGQDRTIAYHITHSLLIGAPFIVRDDGGGSAAGALTAFLHGSLPVLQECLDGAFTTGQFDSVMQTITPLRVGQLARATT